MPGRLTSNVYFARPVTLATASSRGCGFPTTACLSPSCQGIGSPSGISIESSFGSEGMPTLILTGSSWLMSAPSLHRGRRALGRAEHVDVGAASADVARDRPGDLV